MVDADIASSKEYTEFESKHNRHLNMMAESDRNLRRQALAEFSKVASNEKSQAVIQFFYREKLARRLVIALEDQIEKNRETSIEIFTKMIQRVGLKEEAQILLPAIANRLNKTPFPEPSEEVRVALIDLLEVCLDSDKFQFLPVMGMICGALSRACGDSNPEMKQKAAMFASALAKAHPEKCGQFMKFTIDALTLNLGHQHSKVRRVTLTGMQDVCVARNAEIFLNDNLIHLRVVLNDRSQDVRLTFYTVLKHWMTHMEIQSLRHFESNFVLYLLNGASDENQEIAASCIVFLEEHGGRMRDALQQLGEVEDEEMKSEDQSQDK